MNRMSPVRTQLGLSLIELMVALLITGALLAGVVTVFASSSRAGRTQMVIAGLNDSGRFAIDTLARDLRLAGYRDTDWMLGAMTDPAPIEGLNRVAADGGDTITVRYQAARDCAFVAAPGGLATNTYAVVAGELRCNNLAIAAGVEQMQVYFGEDTDNDGVANRLLAPGTAGLDMTRVVSLRVHLLVRSNSVNAAAGAQSYFFDNAIQPPVGDGQVRREYSLTVALRNPT
jgi:type IV pilus assembly protein PilW